MVIEIKKKQDKNDVAMRMFCAWLFCTWIIGPGEAMKMKITAYGTASAS